MKSLNLLSIVVLLSVSGQALAQVPPPLKPVEYLEPDDVKTTPTQPTTPVVVTQPQPKPQPQPVKPTTPPVVTQPTKPTTTTVKPPVVLPPTQPTKPTKPVIAPKPTKPVVQPPKPVVTQPKPQPVKPNKVGAFKIGDEVATDRHDIGFIVDFVSPQIALVRFSHGTYEWPVNRMAFLLEQSRGFRVGEVVVSDRHERGVIDVIFADETAIVRFNSGVYTWPLSRLSHEVTKIDGYAVGMSVVTDRHDKGVIVEMYADRTATVQFPNGERYNWPLSRLSREVTTLDGFHVGMSVATDRRDTGVIEQIFADRTANVRFRGGEVYNWPLNRLGPAFYGQR